MAVAEPSMAGRRQACPGNNNRDAPMYQLKVLETEHYTDRLFRFRTERPDALRFRSGEFIMIGLPKEDGKPLLRAYSIASPAWEENLEFYSIKVPDGPLTSRLQKIAVGDEITMGKKPTGTLVLDALRPGKRLWMISTGTGIAPFASLVRDPDIYEQFDDVIVTHTCRDVAELAYSQNLVEDTRNHEVLGEIATPKLRYFASTTREVSPQMGRITTLIESGLLFDQLGVSGFQPETDRLMICGSLDMCKDVAALAEEAGLVEGANSEPGDFVIEKAFVG